MANREKSEGKRDQSIAELDNAPIPAKREYKDNNQQEAMQVDANVEPIDDRKAINKTIAIDHNYIKIDTEIIVAPPLNAVAPLALLPAFHCYNPFLRYDWWDMVD